MLVSERAMVGSEVLVSEGALVGFIIPHLDVTKLDLSGTCATNPVCMH